MSRRLGPDATRYWIAGGGEAVSRPFHARWLLPALCGQRERFWWVAWLTGWVFMAGGMVGWRLAAGDDWRVAVAAGGLLLGLPGILGPSVTIPVGVDIPATGVTLVALALCELGNWPGGIALLLVAASIRETAPVWAALWLWHPLPLVALVAVAGAYVFRKSGPDPLGPRFQQIADHPFRSALAAHRHQWRDAWVMVAPWGVCLAALHSPSWQVVAVLAVAYAQLLVATDTVRLVHHGAGPVMAVAAASVIPVGWLALAVVVHVVWWRKPERI